MWIMAIAVAGFLIWCRKKGHLDMRWFALLLALDLLGGAAAFGESLQGSKETVTELAREQETDQQIPVEVQTDEGQSWEIDLPVPQIRYTDQEVRTMLQEAVETLDGQICGRNRDMQEICYDLELPETIGPAKIAVSWYSDHPDILSDDGVIAPGVPEKGCDVTLNATLRLQDETEEYTRILHVCPSQEEDAMLRTIEQEAEKINQDGSEDPSVYRLPDRAGQVKLTWLRPRKRRGAMICAMSGLLACLLLSLQRRRRVEAEQARREEMERDYPELLSRICLLLHAGLSMRRIVAYIADDYENRCREGEARRCAYEELSRCRRRMERGLAERAAYEEFGDRCAVPAYRSLALLLAQNQKRGGSDLVKILEREMSATFENSKRRARAAGEKVTVKLLLPMVMMLAVVIALIMIPAFLGL